jgi:hypothetical protein
MSSDVVLTGARWSVVSRTECPRAGAYGAYQTPEDVPDAEEQERRDRYFQRGHDICNAHRERDAKRLAAQGYTCEEEAEIQWAQGIGHADLRATGPRGKLIVEYTTTKGGDLAEHKVLQVVGYAIADGADAAAVASIDPHTYERHDYPIRIAAHADRARALMDTVDDYVRIGEVPERTCATPHEGRYKMCPFVSTCFDGWTGSPPKRLDGLERELLRLADLEDAIKQTPRGVPVDPEVEGERDALREQLAFYCDPGVEYVTAGISIKRTVSKPTIRFALAKARKAGWDIGCTKDELAAFVSETTSERWTLKRIEERAA